VEFGDLSDADLIRITSNLNEELASVVNRETIRAVVDWLSARGDGWFVPPQGVRVARLRLNFSRGDRSVGNVGVGQGYLTAHRKGRFYQRDADPQDREALLGLLGFDLGHD
jgi:hypothetical protein